MVDLNKVAEEIREILRKKTEELCLSFVEETHTYSIKDSFGLMQSDYPSVSSIVHEFYKPFDTYGKSLSMCNGDKEKQAKLLLEWEAKGYFATNVGSRTHFLLEIELVKRFGNYKQVREPIFICNEEQIIKSDNMVVAGNKFLDLMINERKCVLLDTETVLGSNNLGYFGAPDKLWLATNKKELFIYISDWKTNKPEKFVPQYYTERLYPPFQNYFSTDLEHYYIQLVLYIRLLQDMLLGSKYEGLRLGGCIVVLVKDDQTYQEYRVPQFFINQLLTMDLKPYIKLKNEYEKYNCN